MDFRSLSLPEAVLRGIDAAGFVLCTPIQEKVLPLSLVGKDVAGQAQTGTGKTAAFLITIFSRLLRRRPGREHGPGAAAPRALVVAPTRELALQILHDAESLGQFTGLHACAVFGGVDYAKQREELRRGCDLLIGTPGRLIDYFKQHVYTLRHIEVLVIDEADRMFDMGFIGDLRYLLRRLPPYEKRQSMLFSATLSWDVMELAYEYMNDPVKLSVTPEQVTAENIEHRLYHVGRHEKLPLLLGIFQREAPKRALVFVNTKREANWLTSRLKDHGYHAGALTGDVNQRVRLRLIREFKAGTLPVLVATDVASRGLHVEGVSHVINYDLPEDPENYVHRIGRTARAGASGRAISLACEEYVMSLEEIERFIGFKLPVGHVDDDMLVQLLPPRHRTRTQTASEGRRNPGGRRRRHRERLRDDRTERVREEATGRTGVTG